jgi:hypothetical protein
MTTTDLGRRVVVACLVQPVLAALVSLAILFGRLGLAFKPTGQILLFVLAGTLPLWLIAAVAMMSNRASENVVRPWRSFLVAVATTGVIIVYAAVAAEYAVATLQPGFSTVGCDLLVLPIVSFVIGTTTYFVARAAFRIYGERTSSAGPA